MLLASRTASRGAWLCFLERLLLHTHEHSTDILYRAGINSSGQLRFFRSPRTKPATPTNRSLQSTLTAHILATSLMLAQHPHIRYIYRSIASPTLSLCLSLPLLSIVTLTLRFSLDILYKRHAALRARVAPHPRRDHTIGGRLSRRHQKAFTMPEAEEGIST